MDDAESGLASGRWAPHSGSTLKAVCPEAPAMTTNAANGTGAEAPVGDTIDPDYLPSGSSFFLSLPGMYGLHGAALTGPGVFHTTLNWPSAFTSPMNTGLCRWWFFSSIFTSMPDGALKVWPAMAAMTLSVSVDLAFSTACAHMWMPM